MPKRFVAGSTAKYVVKRMAQGALLMDKREESAVEWRVLSMTCSSRNKEDRGGIGLSELWAIDKAQLLKRLVLKMAMECRRLVRPYLT